MNIDVHVHIVGTDPKHGCFISQKLDRKFTTRFMIKKYGLGGFKGAERDRLYAKKVARWVERSTVDRAVVFGMDGRYDRRGVLDESKTDLFVSNEYVFQVVEEYPNVFLPAVSIHPGRRDALDAVSEAAERGAVLVKWLPNSQGFNPMDEAFTPFYQRLAELNLPLLSHTGFEHTIPPIDQSLGDPSLLQRALEEGVTVIAAHSGTSGLIHRKEHMGTFLDLLEKFPNLYGDISALGNAMRMPYLPKLLADPRTQGRLLYGSDFPVPINPLLFAGRIGLRNALIMLKQSNPIQQAIDFARKMGTPDDVFERAALLIGPKTG